MISCTCKGLGCKLCKAKEQPKVFIPIDPMGAVRTTQKAKGWGTEAGRRYAAYKRAVALLAASRLNFIDAGRAVVITDLVFYMPMPKTGKTSGLINGKRVSRDVQEGTPHISKPDTDNLIKGLFDALNGVAWKDDAQVYKITNISKVYSEYPGIEFGIEFIEL